MKKIALSFVIIFLLVGCRTNNKQQVALFNGITFRLNAGEEVVNIDSTKNAVYNKYVDNNSVQIPLFRCIQGADYVIFLGIPVGASIKRLIPKNVSSKENKAFESDSSSYFYSAFTHDDKCVTKSSMMIDNNLIYILTISPSSTLSDSLFSKHQLTKRFEK